MRRLDTVLALSICLGATPALAARTVDADRLAIVQLEARQAAAWNAHDAHAYAQLFAPDADTVNVLGWWWTSRAELERKLAAAFAVVFAHSLLHVDEVTLRTLSPDLAIAHVRWSMSGAMSPDGSGGNVPQHGIQTQVVRRTSAGWRIVALQNTNAVPERPFRTTP